MTEHGMRTGPVFAVGDRVAVMWMGGRAEGEIAQVQIKSPNGNSFKEPNYRVLLPGLAPGRPWYRESEIEAVEG